MPGEPPTPKPPADELLREYLAGRDASCPVCGYNLRDLTRPLCPECGNALALTVGAPTFTIGWLVLTLTPMLMMLGIGVLLLAGTLAWGPPGGEVARILFALAAVDLVLATATYRMRFRFYRLSRTWQQRLSGISWAAHAAALGFTMTQGSL